MKEKSRQLTLAAMLVALATALSAFSIPIGASRCFPVQHFVNVLAGMVLGPLLGTLCAFSASVLRLLLGTGTLLAFPGSMIGAFLCGLAFKYTKKIWAGCLGEVVGTGILGALAAWPISVYILGNSAAALFGLVIPFCISSAAGAVLGSILIYALQRTKVLEKMLSY